MIKLQVVNQGSSIYFMYRTSLFWLLVLKEDRSWVNKGVVDVQVATWSLTPACSGYTVGQ